MTGEEHQTMHVIAFDGDVFRLASNVGLFTSEDGGEMQIAGEGFPSVLMGTFEREGIENKFNTIEEAIIAASKNFLFPEQSV